MSEELYYIQSRDRVFGNDAVWWRPRSSGYTSLLDDAGKYTKAEADAIKCREHVPVPVAEVDAVAHRSVDLSAAREIERRLA